MPESTIVVKNKYYPIGLNEGQVLKHYSKYKNVIIKEINNRPVLLFIYPDVNKWVIRRNIKNNNIYLNRDNYDSIITGRTVSISVERKNLISYFCIDVDPGLRVQEDDIKKATIELSKNKDLLFYTKSVRITSTSKGYHVYFFLYKPMSMTSSLQILKPILTNYRYDYVIGGKAPKPNQIKFDMATNINKGSHTVMNALTREGLVCMDVTTTLQQFERRKVIIK